ncbi:hypothetical protein B9Z55_001450 [Caenorhabditis nigoni]|uniref:Uncharacterized protein n=1 Tax=Caenorhabditis nigoni TaxID=1611254 RepID=A0A2G5VFX1_9PELO|nr:hypothetical protein B9Z55_001450 [Caenorhabditis nigoni]
MQNVEKIQKTIDMYKKLADRYGYENRNLKNVIKEKNEENLKLHAEIQQLKNALAEEKVRRSQRHKNDDDWEVLR